MTTAVAIGSGNLERAEVLKAAMVALVLGLGLLFLTGFAQPEVIHNAAHDVRHGLSFPCH
ncbi:CbtB domain-containing protein [Reyranella sp.]|uniref:CbtB domain-containing protein n=1 Tax=Reyranella sp. TaxID=1929291 RepID=UPI003C7D9876